MNAVAAREIIARARALGRRVLSEPDGKAVLAAFGATVPRSIVVADAAEAGRRAATLTPPLAVKLISADILHKSDLGGVALNLDHAEAVGAAVESMAARPEIANARIDGWLVEEMIAPGREVAVGGIKDARFGPMLMVGLGGIFVEVLEDVAFRLCPIDEADAHGMLAQLRAVGLLDGARGEPAADKAALIDLMLQVGGRGGLLLELAEEIAELDVNPVIVARHGATVADARFILADAADTEADAVGHDPPDAGLAPLDRFRPLFEPATVAVLGASARDLTMANTFIRRMKAFGYGGAIYPIHPSADEIEGLKAYPDLGTTPEPVDYAYVGIAARRIPEALSAANGRCRIAQVISSGFGEVEDGKELERTLVASAHAAGVRVLGPNCLGTYSPRGGLTFPADAPAELGHIGVVSQSGGLSTDIIKRGQWRGLRFSGLVTIGNSADVTPRDLVEYYLDDAQTVAIGLYLEDIKDGRSFFELLRSRRALKPIVLLRGGRSGQGRIAAASHTGALAGDGRAWEALCAQTPVAQVSTVDEFIDALLALQHLALRPERPTRSVALFGNGGGSSVLGADLFAELGLDVSPFVPEVVDRLEALGLPPGTSVANPIDTPVRTLQEKDGWIAAEILEIVYRHARPDALAMHLNLAAFVGRGPVDPVGNLFEAVRQTREKWPGQAHFALALRSDGSPDLDEKRRLYRERARAIGVPVYDEIPDMARALAVVARLERRLAERGPA